MPSAARKSVTVDYFDDMHGFLSEIIVAAISNMKCVVLCALAIALLGAAGCKKETATATTTRPATPLQEQTNGEAAAADTTSIQTQEGIPTHGPGLGTGSAEPVVIQNDASTDQVLGRLSLELRKYVLRTKAAPKTFEEFLAHANVQAPPPPAGKKYAIDNGAVVLKPAS
jgi:hypothetical protein